MKTERKASWWKLHILIVITFAILFLITAADISPFVRKLLEIGMILSSYILVGLWAFSNAAALEAEDRERQHVSRQPWHPSWWRPGLSRQQYHYLMVQYGTVKPPRKEPAK